jgi:hypothetical protein
MIGYVVQFAVCTWALHSLNMKGAVNMLRKVAALCFMVALVVAVSAPAFARADTKKETRVEGKVIRRSVDKSTLTVHMSKPDVEKTVYYDSSTKWTSAYHKDKKVNDIDAKEVGDGDQVICVGSYDDKGEFHATMISKRLSHPAQ